MKTEGKHSAGAGLGHTGLYSAVALHSVDLRAD